MKTSRIRRCWHCKTYLPLRPLAALAPSFNDLFMRRWLGVSAHFMGLVCLLVRVLLGSGSNFPGFKTFRKGHSSPKRPKHLGESSLVLAFVPGIRSRASNGVMLPVRWACVGSNRFLFRCTVHQHILCQPSSAGLEFLQLACHVFSHL